MKNVTARVRSADRNIFDDLKSGRKLIETRAATVKYRDVASGDTITFVCERERLVKNVEKVYRWPNVESMVREVAFEKIMPRAASMEDVRKAYASYPGYTEKIREFGIIGFELS